MTLKRDTPIQTRRARNGYTPLPNKQTTVHPPEYTVPLRSHTVFTGSDAGSFQTVDSRGGNG